MDQDKGKASRLTNRTPNFVMHHFELRMCDGDIHKVHLLLLRGEMGKFVWFHYE